MKGREHGGGQALTDRNFPATVYVMHYTPLRDRKASIIEQFNKAGIENVVFVESMDRESLQEADLAKYYKPDPEKWKRMFIRTRTIFIEGNYWRPDKKSWAEGVHDDGKFWLPFKPLSKGELSLCCKHARALQAISESNDAYAVIFEDDVLLADDFGPKFSARMSATPGDWDIIFLGSALHHRPPERTPGVLAYKMDPPRGKCSDSYIVKPATAKALVEHMVPFTQPIDFELIYWMNELSLNCYWWDPPIVTQGSQNGTFACSLR